MILDGFGLHPLKKRCSSYLENSVGKLTSLSNFFDEYHYQSINWKK